MVSATPVVLILGAGQGVGAHCTRYFSARGYSVALAARSMQDNVVREGILELHTDLARPELIKDVFAKVKVELGTPSVVVYNGPAIHVITSKSDIS